MKTIAENKDGNKIVLFVDDEKIVLEVGSLMLQKLGYRVITASKGDEALEILKENKVALVILDMKMPSMNGVEIYSQLKNIHANVKVLLASGYIGDHSEKGLFNIGFDGFIQKPFDFKQLSEKLKAILDS
jgi:two-component system cell cycle sensor histidine kinase/response regulator CckA